MLRPFLSRRIYLVIALGLSITVAGMSRKRWWRSPAGHWSRYFSRYLVPAGKTPWRNFCNPGRKLKTVVSRWIKPAENRVRWDEKFEDGQKTVMMIK